MSKNPKFPEDYFVCPKGSVNPPARVHVSAILYGFCAAVAIAIPVAMGTLKFYDHLRANERQAITERAAHAASAPPVPAAVRATRAVPPAAPTP